MSLLIIREIRLWFNKLSVTLMRSIAVTQTRTLPFTQGSAWSKTMHWKQTLLAVIWGYVILVFAQDKQAENCGKRPKSVSSISRHNDRIVGGKESLPGAWPWSASIFHKVIQTRFCGATLVHPQWLLTAAHCFKWNFPDDEWFVEIGKYSTQMDESFTQYRDVVKIVKHPRFDDSQGSYNDLALVKLNDSFDLDNITYAVNSICLSNYDLLDKNEFDDCFTIGWGYDQKEGNASEYLREVRLPLVSAEKCFAAHEFKYDANTQICAGGLEQGGAGTCFGDSGGPLMCKTHVQERWHLLGITSYGKACALPETADVFTKVAAYSDWIKEYL